MQRASVDLPQPVSPTRPRVSPRGMDSDTSSTAWTWPTVRLTVPPARDREVLDQVLHPDQHVVADGSGSALAFLVGWPGTGWLGTHPATLPSDSGPGDLGVEYLGGRLAAALADRLRTQFFGLLAQARRLDRQPARRAVVAASPDRGAARLLGQAPVEHVAAAGMERAAGRQVDQAGRRPGIGRSRSPAAELLGIDSSSPLVYGWCGA